MRFISRVLTLAMLACMPIFIAHAALPQHTESFSLWLVEFYQDAEKHGIRREVLDAAMAGVSPIPRVIELDRKQPETTLTLSEYLDRVLPQSRMEEAQARYQEHRELLEEIGVKYGVPPKVIVALWGIESNFGENMGNYDVIAALATLAYDGRRSEFFRKELLNALTILQEEHIDREGIMGSWAGAMGQCQFMPSSFLKYAVDYNGDGRKDIWFSEADVFASIANYLRGAGWDSQKGWDEGTAERDNFEVLLKWNRSRYFATAVSILADSIKEQS